MVFAEEEWGSTLFDGLMLVVDPVAMPLRIVEALPGIASRRT
ncbi:hypothetical protein DKAM_0087 [Desulfurococcus amylolyticus 1221n]|uniref:Uncharacterized protein n=1 Tax=Desulfurococcus amylolyticus (strain DSM 18924 / JCM 16383 / VKM B-2413 / 1221n) TaxID=490899 RepID=B8D2P5_DESA1|nr:hypothetical protein [Desulfurococcus amylolyticus]ACL10416.1 hypothetical protein DKAM_0087 [Desulfurococcus amylolyticus 1221n]